MTDASSNYAGRDLEAMAHARNYNRWIAAAFRPYLRGDVLEVGAGCGNVSPYLIAAGAERLTAVEPSEQMFPLLTGKLHDLPNATPRRGVSADVLEETPGAFDAVTYVNVLEHIRDDEAELRRCRRLLRPGGHALILVPALPCLYSEFDRSIGHYRRYTRKELRTKAAKSGLGIVRAYYFDAVGAPLWFLYFRCLRGQMRAGGVSLFDTVVVPVMRPLERMIRPPIGKNVILVAKRV